MGVADRTSQEYRWRDVWPRKRKGRSLPPGQKPVAPMPRFSARPWVPPPSVPAEARLTVGGAVANELTLSMEQLEAVERVDVVADFHCVTTWSVLDLNWSGWRLTDIWEQVVLTEAKPDEGTTHLKAKGLDGYFAVLDIEDALSSDVLIADRLEGEPLDAIHGAPFRLVSPAQYGYKNVKYLTRLSLYTTPPRRFGGRIEHPRARVDHEERHASIGGRLLRWPYRLLILPTSLIGRRSARQG